MPPPTRQTNRPAGRPASSLQGGSAWDRVDKIRMLLYGQSGTGKTTLWATFPDPILALLCSGGTNPGELISIDTPENRERIRAEVCDSMDDFRVLMEEAPQYQTVVLDHASGFSDLVMMEILGIKEIPVQKGWGFASQQQYGELALRCKTAFRSLLSLPCNVVIVAQERVFGDDTGSEVIRPTVGASLTPSVVSWLNPACDYVCQTFIRPKIVKVEESIAGKKVMMEKRAKGVEYCLRTAPHDIYASKFRSVKGSYKPEVIVDPSYEKILQVARGQYKDPLAPQQKAPAPPGKMPGK